MQIKSKTLFGILTIILILFSGCIGTQQIKPESPPAKIPSLNVYGELLDYTQNGDILTFKIQAEIINYELNNTYLEIETKPEEFYNFTDDYLRCIKQSWYPTEEECKNYFFQEYNLSQKCRNITELPEKGLVYLRCDVKFELEKNSRYVFYFYKTENGPWSRVTISGNTTEYKEESSHYHESDLMYNFVREIIPYECKEEAGHGCVSQMIELIFKPNEAGKIQINLTNKQDNQLSFDIDAKVLDFYKLEPNINYCPQEGYFIDPNGRKETCIPKTFEEKLKDAIVDSCISSHLSNIYSIEPKTSKTLDFSVTCNEPLGCIEEPHYPNRTCNLILYVNISWTDELDNYHSMATDYFVPTFYIE